MNEEYRVAQAKLKAAKAEFRRAVAAQARKDLTAQHSRLSAECPAFRPNTNLVSEPETCEENDEIVANEARQFRSLFELKNVPDSDVGEAQKVEHSSTIATPVKVNKIFGGKTILTPGSLVLARPTVFTPYVDEDAAPWPELAQIKYEGDDRIKTDKIHGRFLPAPRNQSNATVNWMHRSLRIQKELENFHYPPQAAEIFLRNHHVAELDFDDNQGDEILGKDLMGLLNAATDVV